MHSTVRVVRTGLTNNLKLRRKKKCQIFKRELPEKWWHGIQKGDKYTIAQEVTEGTYDACFA